MLDHAYLIVLFGLCGGFYAILAIDMFGWGGKVAGPHWLQVRRPWSEVAARQDYKLPPKVSARGAKDESGAPF